MQLERDPESQEHILLTPENPDESGRLLEILDIPPSRGTASYKNQAAELLKTSGTPKPEKYPTLRFTARQLRWIGRNLAGKSARVVRFQSPEEIALAREKEELSLKMAEEISDFLVPGK